MVDEVDDWWNMHTPEEFDLLKESLHEAFDIKLSIIGTNGSNISQWTVAVEKMDGVHRFAEAVRSQLPNSEIRGQCPEYRGPDYPFLYVRKDYPDGRIFVVGILEYAEWMSEMWRRLSPKDVQGLPELIAEFEELLSLDPPERDLHLFLNRHRYLLCTDYEEVIYEAPITVPQIGSTEQSCRADFLIKRKSKPGILIELERSSHLIFTKDGEFTKEVRHGLRQLNDWFRVIADNKATMLASAKLSSLPDGWLIIGRRETLSDRDHKVLLSRNEREQIRIFTYDDLLDSARNTYKNLQGRI